MTKPASRSIKELWLTGEMCFEFDEKAQVYVFHVSDHQHVFVGKELLEMKSSLGTFQRSIVNMIAKARGKYES